MHAPIPDNVQALRARHPILTYQSYSISPVAAGLRLEYEFILSPSHVFTPSLVIPSSSPCVDDITNRLAFLIGMVELLSYWKLACPPLIEVAAGPLSDSETSFWEALTRNGMGEYLYQNKIPPSLDLSIKPTRSENTKKFSNTKAPSNDTVDSYMVLVGGGKDSTVSLELLKQLPSITSEALSSFVVNPIPASLEAIKAAGYPASYVATRSLDPKLFELNAQGYLNGHTPFSALLAFVSTLAAYQNGYRYALASNEASASEGNVTFDGTEINHQYSKSFDFESRFRAYMREMNTPVEYLSFLRPLNELQVCALFSTLSGHHSIFRSCNREQTRTAREKTRGSDEESTRVRGWCAECPKCIFTYLCLSCFLSQPEITSIFGVSPREVPGFAKTLSELAGFSEHKPFECVGTFEEVRACLRHLFSTGVLSSTATHDMAYVCSVLEKTTGPDVRELLMRWNDHNFLGETLAAMLRKKVTNAVEGLIR